MARGDPGLHVEPDAQVLLAPVPDPGHDRDRPRLALADLAGQGPHVGDEAVHRRNPGLGIGAPEVQREEHEIQLDAVRFVVLQDLADQAELLLADLGIGVVVAPLGLVIGEAVVRRPQGDLHAPAPLEPAAALAALGRGVLQLETGEDPDSGLPAVADHLPQLVGAQGRGVPDHAHDAPVDELVPDLLLLADDAPDAGLVEVDVAEAEAEGEQVHAGAGELVDGPAHLVKAEGRIDALGVEVVGVAVVDQTRGAGRVRQRLHVLSWGGAFSGRGQ